MGKKFFSSEGFALPTVLLASTVLLIVLVVSVSSAVSVSVSINDQYYNRLAQEAAESGVARAVDCLKANEYEVTWSGKTLRPNTNCSGDAQGTACPTDATGNLLGTNPANCFIMKTSSIVTSFSVDTPVRPNVLTVRAVAMQLRSDGSVAKKYDTRISSRVSSAIGVNKITFGYSNNGAYFATIANDGVTRTVGYNGWGQLGNGSTDSSTLPVEYILPDGEYSADTYASFLSLGYNLFSVTNQGNVYGAGLNNYGQLGNGTTSNRSTPVKFNLPAGDSGAIFVAPLGNRTYVLTDQGNVYAAGRCSLGALGDGQSTSSCSNRSTPVKVSLPSSETPTTNMVSDSDSVIVRMQSGKVYGWGGNGQGQLGTGNTTHRSTPVQIGTFGNSGQPKAVQVAFDGVTTFILADNGRVYVTGRANYGVAGFMPSTTCSGDPCLTSVTEYAQGNAPWKASGATVEQIDTDQWCVVFRTSDGKVWGSGQNNSGQLGNGNTANQTTAVQFNLPSGQTAVDIYQASVGLNDGGDYNNTFVVTASGRIYGAGANVFGQLGNGSVTTRSANPILMNVFGSAVKASRVSAGFGSVVILTEGGKVYTVGNNSNGQLGDGTTNNSSVPKANRYTNIIPVTQY